MFINYLCLIYDWVVYKGVLNVTKHWAWATLPGGCPYNIVSHMKNVGWRLSLGEKKKQERRAVGHRARHDDLGSARSGKTRKEKRRRKKQRPPRCVEKKKTKRRMHKYMHTPHKGKSRATGPFNKASFVLLDFFLFFLFFRPSLGATAASLSHEGAHLEESAGSRKRPVLAGQTTTHAGHRPPK